MYQVNKLLIKPNLTKQFFRNVFRQKPLKILYPLQSRSLLKISGNETPTFLQGLITNDMQHFEEKGINSMYAMFLNNKGRVLYDILLHKWEGNDSFLLECDKNVHAAIQKHLNVYKLKRNVEIEDVNDNFRIFALITPRETEIDTTIHTKKNVNIFKDPRLTELGHRVIAKTKADNKYIENTLGEKTVIPGDDMGYRYLRYKLGVSEGAEELPPGVSFPLEVNCDYLHGVSFHKGCYIGQELTARVHHTGVVRKRIMPIKFLEVLEDDVKKDLVIIADNNKKSNVGKLKVSVNDYGIGLVRVKEALEAKVLEIEDLKVKIEKPNWWPIEAPKDKIAAKAE